MQCAFLPFFLKRRQEISSQKWKLPKWSDVCHSQPITTVYVLFHLIKPLQRMGYQSLLFAFAITSPTNNRHIYFRVNDFWWFQFSLLQEERTDIISNIIFELNLNEKLLIWSLWLFLINLTSRYFFTIIIYLYTIYRRIKVIDTKSKLLKL